MSSSTTSSFSIRRWWRIRRASASRRADRDGGEIVPGHQLADRLTGLLGEADVAVGEDSAELAGFLDDRDAADAVAPHQLQRLGECLVGRHGDRVDDHAAFEPLHLPNGERLILDR